MGFFESLWMKYAEWAVDHWLINVLIYIVLLVLVLYIALKLIFSLISGIGIMLGTFLGWGGGSAPDGGLSSGNSEKSSCEVESPEPVIVYGAKPSKSEENSVRADADFFGPNSTMWTGNSSSDFDD